MNLKEQAIRAGDRLAKYLTSMLPQLAKIDALESRTDFQSVKKRR